MDLEVPFSFRGKDFLCKAFIDFSEYPCYIFVLLEDEDLVYEFGEEISIKNDLEKLLPKRGDYPALMELRLAIFGNIKTKPAFLFIKEKFKRTNKAIMEKYQRNV